MAHHLSEQKSYKNCRLLLKELERVVEEELQLREKLIETGVRDVSDQIELPKNSLDQLDEDSAEYDDKRLCHACKHVCFFSAVACVCSQSKVSCLRHSHYMCRCPVERRYLMVWSKKEELSSTLERVRNHCESLKPKGGEEAATEDVCSSDTLDTLPPVAVGSERDLEEHKADPIKVEPYDANEVWVPLKSGPVTANDGLSLHGVKSEVTTDTTTIKTEVVEIVDDDDDDIELVAIRGTSNTYTF